MPGTSWSWRNGNSSRSHVLGGQPGTERSLALFNAGAAIYVGGLADSLAGGVERAQQSFDSGAATGVLDAYVERAR